MTRTLSTTILGVLFILSTAASAGTISYNQCTPPDSNGAMQCYSGGITQDPTSVEPVNLFDNSWGGIWAQNGTITRDHSNSWTTTTDYLSWNSGSLVFRSMDIGTQVNDLNTISMSGPYTTVIHEDSSSINWTLSTNNHWFDCSRQDCPQGGDVTRVQGGGMQGLLYYTNLFNGLPYDVGVSPLNFDYPITVDFWTYGLPRDQVLGAIGGGTPSGPSANSAPEPVTLITIGMPLAMLGLYRRRRAAH